MNLSNGPASTEMTLRLHIAVEAMKVLIERAHTEIDAGVLPNNIHFISKVAKASFFVADAMIAEAQK